MADRELSKSSAKAYGFESHSRHISTCGETGKHDGLKIHFRQRITSSSLVGCIFLGVAKLVSRLFWEQETASSNLVAQTSSKGHVEFFIHIIPGSLETEQCDVVSWVYDAPSPSGKAEDFDSSIAGSTPAGAICGYGGMADTPDLGSGASACGFDAHYPHHGHRMVAYRLLISFTIIPSSPVMVQ